MSHLKYTVRPWVRSGFSMPATSYSGALNAITLDGTDETTQTIRWVDPASTGASPQSIDGSRSNSTSPARNPATPSQALRCSRPSSVHIKQVHHASKSVLLNPRGQTWACPKTPPSGRERGMAVPLKSSRPSIQDQDSESALRLTPSASSKHITHWLSGLLGR